MNEAFFSVFGDFFVMRNVRIETCLKLCVENGIKFMNDANVSWKNE